MAVAPRPPEIRACLQARDHVGAAIAISVETEVGVQKGTVRGLAASAPRHARLASELDDQHQRLRRPWVTMSADSGGGLLPREGSEQLLRAAR